MCCEILADLYLPENRIWSSYTDAKTGSGSLEVTRAVMLSVAINSTETTLLIFHIYCHTGFSRII